jgi:hypothetical protein
MQPEQVKKPVVVKVAVFPVVTAPVEVEVVGELLLQDELGSAC